MKVVKISLLVIAALLIVLAVTAPIGPLPGFFIGGTPSATPASWPDNSDVHEYRPNYPDIVAGFPSVAEAESQIGVFRLDRRRS